MAVGGDTSILDIEDLDKVKTELKKFKKSDWRKLGSEAGLSYNTLDEIENNKKKVEDCFEECLACWLRRQDKVDEKGKPSRRRLAEILKKIGDRALAGDISLRAECSNGILTEKPSETPQSSISNIEPEITIEDYDAMKKKLSQFVTSAIRDISLDDIKIFLIGCNEKIKKMIKEVPDKLEMTSYCIANFSLSNVTALENLAQQCKGHIAKQFDDLLNNRNIFYENILAKDFAMESIEDHDGMCEANSTITFKVSWNEDEARLEKFEMFLSTAFQNYKIYIRLRVVHLSGQSRLMFVCSIANCLKEEITVYVTEKKKYLISKEIVEVTIDQDVIFNVEGGYAALILYEPNDIMKFTAVRSIHLAALLKNLQYSEVGLIHHFHFDKMSGSIELKLCNKLQPAGWTIKPQPVDIPCKLYQDDIDKFNGTNSSLPQSCVILVRGSPDSKTEPILHYPITLKGIKCGPVELYIHRILESTIPETPITSYIGLVYWERKEDEYLIGFVAAAATAKKFKSLVEFIENQHPLAFIQLVNFDFDSNSSYIKLSATFHEKSEPQLLSKEEIDNYNEVSHDPPSCQISFFPDPAQSVQCSLSLKDVTEPILNCKPPQTLDKNSYIGLVYYEWEKKEYLMTFLAGKKLTKIAQYIEKYHPQAEINQLFYFSFSSRHSFIELQLNSSLNDHSSDSYKGWTVQPLVKPCRLYQNDIDEFGKTVSESSVLPPSCLISVHGSPDAVPTLHYSIPLEGVADPVTLYIDRKLQLEKDVLELFFSHDTETNLEVFTENKKKFQRYMQDIAHQNKVSRKRALIKANEQAADDSKKLEDALQENEKLKAKVANSEENIFKLSEEKEQAEERYLKIIKELKTEVKYTAKLMKEKAQLQERITSLEEQSIKKISSIGVQFNYLITSMDLIDVQVAQKKLFLIQGDKPQLINWEKYGLRIGVQEESLSSSEIVEAVAVALVGGQFQFPPNTVLVSAVYAVSLSKPLLKRLKLEIQHCIDLTGQPALSRYLKFAIAPVSTPSLPYQFLIVKGGEFSCNGGYGSIQHKMFSCLVCILREDSTNGGGNGVPIASVNGDTKEREEGEKQQLQHDEEGIKRQQQVVEEKEDNEVVEQKQEEEKAQPQDNNEAEESEYQEEEQDEEGDKEGREDDDDSDSDNTSSTGPGASGAACKESTKETNLPTNTVSVSGPTPTPNTDHVNKVQSTESTAVSSTGGASASVVWSCPLATVDVNKVKEVINDVLAALNSSLPEEAIPDLTCQLHDFHLINNDVRDNPSMDKFVSEFKACLNYKRRLPEVEEHCQRFLSSFIAVRGRYAASAKVLGEDWIEAIRNELGFDFNINIDIDNSKPYN